MIPSRLVLRLDFDCFSLTCKLCNSLQRTDTFKLLYPLFSSTYTHSSYFAPVNLTGFSFKPADHAISAHYAVESICICIDLPRHASQHFSIVYKKAYRKKPDENPITQCIIM